MACCYHSAGNHSQHHRSAHLAAGRSWRAGGNWDTGRLPRDHSRAFVCQRDALFERRFELSSSFSAARSNSPRIPSRYICFHRLSRRTSSETSRVTSRYNQIIAQAEADCFINLRSDYQSSGLRSITGEFTCACLICRQCMSNVTIVKHGSWI